MMRVEELHTNWTEKGQREVGWFTFEEAAESVEEQGLVALLVSLARTDLRQVARRKNELSRRTRWPRTVENGHLSTMAPG